MNEIIAILNTVSPHLKARTLKQMTLLIEAMLSMTGRVTMLSLSRWTEKGGRSDGTAFFLRKNRVVGVTLAAHKATHTGN